MTTQISVPQEHVGTADRPCIDCLDGIGTASRHRFVASQPTAFWLVAWLYALILMGTTLPTPLYVIYQARWDFSSGIITLIFASYAGGVLAALLLAGRASDQVGRRPVLATALGLSALSTVTFILAPDPVWLFLGRILSGFSAGLMTGTGTATLTDLVDASSSRRASLVATAASTAGLGLGPLIAGLFATLAPDPTTAVFAVYAVALVISALGLAFVPETVSPRHKLTLRLSGLTIPSIGRSEFIAAGVAAFAGYSLIGLFTALAPTFLGGELHQHNYAINGAIVALIFGASALTQLTLARFPSRSVVLAGLGLFVVGLAMIVGALAAASLALFLLGTVISGVAVGSIFMGSLATANRLAPVEMRGRVVSTYFVFAYGGLTVPVIGVGIASDYIGDVPAVLACSIVLAVLCAFSVWGIRRAGSRQPTSASPMSAGASRVVRSRGGEGHVA
jgi:MFS family permease